MQCFFPIEKQISLIGNHANKIKIEKKNDYHSFRFKTSDSNSRIYFSLRSDKNKLEIIC